MSNNFQPDFFTGTTVEGLTYAEAVIGPAEEADLIARIDLLDLQPFRFQQWLGKRLTTSFGLQYDFESARLSAAAPIPAWLEPLRLKAAQFAGLEPATLRQVLLTRYDPGAGIGWHRDRPVFGHVIGISLGAPAILRLRQRRPNGFARERLPLEPRSIYQLQGPARYGWEHSIAPLAQARWSITFRTLSRPARPDPDVCKQLRLPSSAAASRSQFDLA